MEDAISREIKRLDRILNTPNYSFKDWVDWSEARINPMWTLDTLTEQE